MLKLVISIDPVTKAVTGGTLYNGGGQMGDPDITLNGFEILKALNHDIDGDVRMSFELDGAAWDEPGNWVTAEVDVHMLAKPVKA